MLLEYSVEHLGKFSRIPIAEGLDYALADKPSQSLLGDSHTVCSFKQELSMTDRGQPVSPGARDPP